MRGRRDKLIAYNVDGRLLNTDAFLLFVGKIWLGHYDIERARAALSKTINITAYDRDKLVGCLRILTDGYYFGTITELLVLPEYQKQGIGSRLLQLARKNTPQCYTSVHSRRRRLFMKRMAAGKACNPI